MTRVFVSGTPIFSALFLETDKTHALLDSDRFMNHHKELEVRDVPDAPPVALEGKVMNRPVPGRPTPAIMPAKSSLRSKTGG